MIFDDDSFYVRVGTAAQAGAPIGASVNIAQVTSSNQQARQAGQVFGQAGQSFFQPGATLNANREVVREPAPAPEKPKSFWDHLGGAVSAIGRPIMRALEWGTETTGNIAEADMRNLDQGYRDGFGSFLRAGVNEVLPFMRLFDDSWKDNWQKAVDAQASVGQTAWLLAEQRMVDNGWIDAGTSGSGIYDDATGTYGPRITSGGLDLLDNPARRGERQEYFSEGAAHWTTGVGDALWQVFADPLIVAGKVATGVKAARATLGIEDVAQLAARNADEAVNLTAKQARAWDLADRLARAVDNADTGAVSALAQSRFLRNSSDGGAISYLMSRAGYDEAGRLIEDEATRLASRRDVIFAGMGDGQALGRLRDRHGLLSVELEKMTSGLDDLDAGAILTRTDVDDTTALAEFYGKLNDTPLAAREIEVQVPRIRRELDAIERVQRVGTPITRIAGEGEAATLAKPMLGELSQLVPTTVRAGKRDVARVVKTIQGGRFLEPIHFVKGRHLPGTFLVSADDAVEVFRSAVVRTRSILAGMDAATRDQFATRLAGLEDNFAAAGIGAGAKAPRTTIMREFDNLVDEIIATKYGQNVTDISALHNVARGRRTAELRQINSRIYKAREANAPAVVNTGDGIYAFADSFTPVLRSQLDDWVSILDPRQLDRLADAHFRNGLGGFVHRVGESGVAQQGEAWLALSNRLWKFGALLRPGAYFVRAQIDTQARMLAMIGPIKYATFAARGSKNLFTNLRYVDKGEVAAFTQRFYLHMAQDRIERELLSAGVDPRAAGLAQLPSQRIRDIEGKIEPLRAQRQGLRYNPTHDPRVAEAKLAELDAKIAKLTDRAVKTRAKLVSQRERLVAGMEDFRKAEKLDAEIGKLSDEITAIRGIPEDKITLLRERYAEVEQKIAEVKTVKTGEKVRRRKTAMAEHVGKNAGFDKAGNWRAAHVSDAYWDNDELQRRIAQMDARDSILGLLTGSTRAELDHLRRTGAWDLIRGNDAQWEGAYLRAVNNQIARDALGMRVLAGWDDAEIKAWFRETAEGRAYLRDLRAAGSGPPEIIIERLRQHVDTLLPEGTPIRAAAMQGRNVQLDDIKNTWQVPSDRPQVPGELLDHEWKHTIMAGYEAVERSYFKWVAEMPENMMGRHPFYAARFEQHAKNAMARAGVENEGALTIQQVNEIRRHAAQMARRDVSRYLFDTSRQSNAGHFLRFLSPFYGAWEDTMLKWARIFSEKPQAAAVMWDVVRSPNAAGWVVDENGNLIDVLGNVRDDNGNVIGHKGIWDGYVLIPLPDIPLPGGDSVHERFGATSLRISKNAANVIFQGDPWVLPGPGPIMAIPANHLVVKMHPEVWGDTEEPQNFGQAVLRYLLPYGPTSDSELEQFMPSWARAGADALTQDGRRVDAVFSQLYMEQLNAERLGQVKPLTDEERIDLIANRTRNWSYLRLMGTQMPFTWTPQSRLAWYKAEYDRYRREYPGDADERFMADYPDYFEMAISLTANETGLTATDESWNAVQRYRSDIAKNPKFGWFFAGAENLGGGFSQGVYHAQLAQPVGPGTDTTFRSRRDPLTVARDAMVDQGWREYQQISQLAQLKLEERGLRSFSAAGAEDLRQLKQEFVADLSQRNPDWAVAYGDSGSARGRVTEFLNFAVTQLNAHPELVERGDGTALATYLQVREMVRQQLASRGLSSIEAGDAADLKGVWDEFTSSLITSDLGFEQMWYRVLEHDDLTGDIYAGGE